jgi:hypothetical protein
MDSSQTPEVKNSAHNGAVETEFDEFGGKSFAVCPCGWRGSERPSLSAALDDLLKHYAMSGA